MTRTPEQVRAALAAAARLTAYGDDHTWHDALFTDDGAFSRPDDPDRALLTALLAEYPELDRHADGLTARAHVDWLERILAVERLPVVPDRVVAHATVDPKLAPAVLPPGTMLRGGKDAFGAERRYATADALTAHGARVVGVRSLVPGGAAGLAAEAGDFPLDPLAGGPAPHTLRLRSPALAFSGGGMTVQVTFQNAAGVAALAPALWAYPRPDGSEAEPVTCSVSGSVVTVVLADGCGVAHGDPWIEARLPADAVVPADLRFTGATIRVSARDAIEPQAAHFNDGLLDVSKEFQPFGAVAKRGDALYLRSDEALAKNLQSLTVTVTVLQEGGAVLEGTVGGSGLPYHVAETIEHEVTFLMAHWGGTSSPEVQDAWATLGGYTTASPANPRVHWQRRVASGWETLSGVSSDRLESFTKTDMPGPVASLPATVGGQPGRYLRAFLSEGDFGWTAYLRDVADFASEAAKGGDPTMPVPPVPPIVSRLLLTYTTKATAVTGVEAVNGWARTRKDGAGTFYPFRLTVPPTGATGMVALGLDLPDDVVGSSVSVHLGVESAAPCGSSEDPDAHWEWRDGGGWQRLPVADGSRLLRESGLLRFVAPAGWAVGCPDVDATTGRWFRLVTAAPERLGVLTQVTPDAVLADFVSAAPVPALDPSPATALPVGTIKGTVSPVAGVKKVTNLASVRGRGPEEDGPYRRRASALARHRGRAAVPWDYEEIVRTAFPEVAAALCLPHTAADGSHQVGAVGLVVLPDSPQDPQPRPSVSLAGRITDALAPMVPVHATPVVLCALYVPVTLTATVELRRGVAALVGKDAVLTALETWLHPAGTRPVRWGRSLYRSSLEAFLESLPEVDSVTELVMRDSAGAAVEVVEVDPCRGLFCSSAAHTIVPREQL